MHIKIKAYTKLKLTSAQHCTVVGTAPHTVEIVLPTEDSTDPQVPGGLEPVVRVGEDGRCDDHHDDHHDDYLSDEQ